mgnify:CR=1 FL=1
MKLMSREYQERIAESAIKNGNTLVVLPTGMGKTLIGALVMEKFLKEKKRCLFLAPTRPLVSQHGKRLNEYFYESYSVTPVTGQTRKEDRMILYGKSDVIISTPQTIKNDIESTATEENPGGILSNFSCIVVDECHRAVGQYAYTYVANSAAEQAGKNGKILLLGLTASPGGSASRIKEITDALSIDNVEIRTETDADVSKYVQKVNVQWREVELPKEMNEAIALLNELMDEKSKTLSELNITISRKTPRGRLSQIYRSLIDNHYMAALGHFAMFYNAFHGVELIESESPLAYSKFVERLKERKKRVDWRFAQAANKLSNIEHPKMHLLSELVTERKGKRIIVFAQYRDQVHHIVGRLNGSGFKAKPFLGKGKGGVAAVREQKKTISEFANGDIDILVASSIGEEGIDIPSADTAIFYEPVPSEIRSIQRRGRVGRAKEGEVIILIAKGTRDEVVKYVSLAKEKKMKGIIRSLGKGKGEKNVPKEIEPEAAVSPPKEAQQSLLSEFIGKQ